MGERKFTQLDVEMTRYTRQVNAEMLQCLLCTQGGIKCAWRVSPSVNGAVSTDELQREEELPPHRGTGQ